MEIQFVRITPKSLQTTGGHHFALSVEKTENVKNTYPRGFSSEVIVPMITVSKKGPVMRKVLQEVDATTIYIFVCHELELVGFYAEEL